MKKLVVLFVVSAGLCMAACRPAAIIRVGE